MAPAQPTVGYCHGASVQCAVSRAHTPQPASRRLRQRTTLSRRRLMAMCRQKHMKPAYRPEDLNPALCKASLHMPHVHARVRPPAIRVPVISQANIFDLSKIANPTKYTPPTMPPPPSPSELRHAMDACVRAGRRRGGGARGGVSVVGLPQDELLVVACGGRFEISPDRCALLESRYVSASPYFLRAAAPLPPLC